MSVQLHCVKYMLEVVGLEYVFGETISTASLFIGTPSVFKLLP